MMHIKNKWANFNLITDFKLQWSGTSLASCSYCLPFHLFCTSLQDIIVCFRFHVDPSGTYNQYEAKAIGSGSEGAQQSLQEVYHKVSY